MSEANATLIGYHVEEFDQFMQVAGFVAKPLTLSLDLLMDDGREVSISRMSAARYMSTPIGARFHVLITEVRE